MTITPGNKNGASLAPEQDLQQASDTPKLELMKDAVTSLQDVARNHYNRTTIAFDWWRAVWPGQTADGRRWGTDAAPDAWPWSGASDTRIRLCEKLVREHSTVGRFALMNAKRQAKSARPLASSRDSQQATTLLNWMLDTHCAEQIYQEQDLMLAWRHGYGAAVTAVEWDQQRRLEYIPVSMMTLAEFVKRVSANLMETDAGYNQQSAISNQQSDKEVALGFIQALGQSQQPLMELQSMIMDPAYEADLGRVIQSMSPVVTKRQATKIVIDLRELRTAEVPVPYVFRSCPRRTTLRPMIDVFFPENTGDLQRATFIDQVEYVSPIDLKDRIETDEYDPGFVNEAIASHRGPSKSGGFGDRLAGVRDGLPTIIGPSGKSPGMNMSKNELLDDIEIHHFHMLVQDRGTPILFTTVFHMDIDTSAKHAPCPYEHGRMIFHGHRLETEQRALLSSRGIPEIAYTWEQELKKQRDGRTDRVDLVLRPPIFTTSYAEMLKLKAQYSPGAMIPIQRFGTMEKDKPPMWDPGSIEIDRTIMQTVRSFFWGDEGDQAMNQMRTQELIDAILAEEKPIVVQQWQLIQQYLPSAKVARVVGPLMRPFEVDREEIQGQYEITITADARWMDKEWIKEWATMVNMALQWDTQGTIDRTDIVRHLFEAADYTLADTAIRDPQAASQGEIQDELKAFALIIGSGRPQPLPQGGNYQLRLTTLQNEMQTAMQSDPDFQKRIQMFPATIKVLQQRVQFFQRQLQQQQNAQIGRTQVADPFTKSAPMLQDQGTGAPQA